MRQRIIVCPLIENDNAFLLCKMAALGRIPRPVGTVRRRRRAG